MQHSPSVRPAAAEVGRDAAASGAAGIGWRQWYLVVVLGVINALSQADRAGLNLIVNPLKNDLGVSDTQISLLLGLSFIILYSVLSVPAGYLVDMLNRRMLLAVAVVFWSAMEIICGVARGYWQLFAGRTGLGLGEAVVAPAAYSLMRDSVAPNSRVRAFALYNLTSVFGTNLGTLVGGILFSSATAGALSAIPLLGSLKPWQVVVVVPGLAGVVIAFLLLTIAEPARTTLPATAVADAAEPGRAIAGFRDAFHYIRANLRLYVPVFGGFLLACLASTGWHSWLAASIGRTWHLTPGEIGRTAGSIGLLLSPLPTFLLAYLMDRLKSRGWAAGPFWVASVCCVINMSAAAFILLAPSLQSLWIAYGVWTVFSYTAIGNVCAMRLLEITPSPLVGKITSLYFLFAYAVGVACGPTLFAAVSEYFFTGPEAIVHAMLVCYPTAIILAIVALLSSARQVRATAGNVSA